jgi:hypothetical protein
MFDFNIGEHVSFYDAYYNRWIRGKIIEILINLTPDSPYYMIKHNKNGMISWICNDKLQRII